MGARGEMMVGESQIYRLTEQLRVREIGVIHNTGENIMTQQIAQNMIMSELKGLTYH